VRLIFIRQVLDSQESIFVSMNAKSKLHWKFSIRPRLVVSFLLAGIVAIFLPSTFHWATRFLCVWDVAMISFLGLSWRFMLRATPEMTHHSALQEDEGRVAILSIITIAACISVVAIGFIPHEKGMVSMALILRLGVAISTIVGSWLLVHTIFAQHYARIYYQGDRTLSERKLSGLDFPGEMEPDYWDFLYFAFIIGMTGQVSDVNVTSRPMRRLSLLQGVLSFFFNTTILAITINIIAGII
jgi:uncharacterized membrane protein